MRFKRFCAFLLLWLAFQSLFWFPFLVRPEHSTVGAGLLGAMGGQKPSYTVAFYPVVVAMILPLFYLAFVSPLFSQDLSQSAAYQFTRMRTRSTWVGQRLLKLWGYTLLWCTLGLGACVGIACLSHIPFGGWETLSVLAHLILLQTLCWIPLGMVTVYLSLFMQTRFSMLLATGFAFIQLLLAQLLDNEKWTLLFPQISGMWIRMVPPAHYSQALSAQFGHSSAFSYPIALLTLILYSVLLTLLILHRINTMDILHTRKDVSF